MVVVRIFDDIFVLRRLRAKRFKKRYTVATPPPWFRNPDRLSKGQVAQVLRFSAVASKTAGKKWEERKPIIQAETSGPTGYAEIRPKIRLPRIGKILTLAERYGLSVPPELRTARPVPVTAPAPRAPAIRE